MENASKALIIAGAVLIAILLIAFGMIMINAAQTPIDTATSGVTSQGVQVFNSQFTGYAGTRVSGSNVKTLLSILQSNNANSSNQIKTTLKFKGATSAALDNAVTGIATQTNNVVNTKTFNVSFDYDDDGYINKCVITEN